MRGLAGKRVLVTGGCSGIGAATVGRFAEEGARLGILDCDAAGLAATDGWPGVELRLVADVGEQSAVGDAFSELDRLWGGLDVLINNAGISIRHTFLETTPEELRSVLRTNLEGAFYVAQEAARRMVAAGGGVILSTASTNGLVGYPLYADYNASKAAIIELTRSLALELAPTVRVNAVAPGYVLTPMQRREYTPAMMSELEAKLPLGRQATPEEVAAVFAFLASDDALYISGQVMVVDGAETAGGLASR